MYARAHTHMPENTHTHTFFSYKHIQPMHNDSQDTDCCEVLCGRFWSCRYLLRHLQKCLHVFVKV